MTKRTRRRLFGLVGLLLGVALFAVELVRALRGLDYSIAFWGLVALGAAGIGAYELFARRGDEERNGPKG